MFSISFPEMFNSLNTKLVQDKQAIRSDMLLLLSTEQGTLFGDPYFGCLLKKYLFEQSSSIVADLLIDQIYTTIITFMPQVVISRKDIDVYVADRTVYVDISYRYALDNSTDLFTIQLTNSSEE